MNDFDRHHGIQPGSHLFQFYRTFDDYFASLRMFLLSGIENHEACLWLVNSLRDHDKIKACLPHFKADLASIEIRSAREWFLKEGKFDVAMAVENAQNYIQQKRQLGFHGMRAFVDVSSIPIDERYLLEEFERRVHNLIHEGLLTAACAYPIDECSLKTAEMVIQHHDHVLIGHH